MLQRPGYFFGTGAISAIIWCILTESFSAGALAAGFFLGIVSSVISGLLSRRQKPVTWGRLRIKFFAVLKYLFILIRNIYKSGFLAIKKIITEQVNVGIVEIDTKLENPINRALLANSITMTPGTVTIEMEGGKIRVLWLEMLELDRKKTGDIIKGDLEDILIRSEQDGCRACNGMCMLSWRNSKHPSEQSFF